MVQSGMMGPLLNVVVTMGDQQEQTTVGSALLLPAVVHVLRSLQGWTSIALALLRFYPELSLRYFIWYQDSMIVMTKMQRWEILTNTKSGYCLLSNMLLIIIGMVGIGADNLTEFSARSARNTVKATGLQYYSIPSFLCSSASTNLLSLLVMLAMILLV